MSNNKSQSGMTLIEVLVSLAMIGALLVLYAAAFNVSILTRNMRNENIAYHIATKKIEELRATPYASLPASASFADSQLSQLSNGSANFTISNYSSYTGVKEAVVTVAWTDGRSRTVSMRTLIGTGGINP
jgi:prepilin-type N-terminal cleavage/methylation domain-containing protein